MSNPTRQSPEDRHDMPYWIHAKESEPETGIPFDDRADAFRVLADGIEENDPQRRARLFTSDATVQTLSRALDHVGWCGPAGDVLNAAIDRVIAESPRQTLTQQTAKITFRASYQENAKWYERERERFRDGTYQRVPWPEFGDNYPAHYLHISIADPGFVAYTPDDESGIRDRQIRVRPGKYLAEFYADYPERHQEWIHCTSPEALKLKLATTPDQIRRVYDNGPRSCMRSWVDGEYNKRGLEDTPVIAYANSDLAVAYMGTLDAVTARAVVWPENKVYTRVYGTESAMLAVLKAHGYTFGDMHGARIRAVPVSDRSGAYYMPYVDGIGNAELDGSEFVLGDGEYDAQVTCGYVDVDHCDSTCDRCDAQYDSNDDDATDEYCGSCAQDRRCCQECDEYEFSSDMRRVGGSWHCQNCYDSHDHTCQYCGDTWNDLLTHEDTNLCESCDGTYELCADCDRWFDSTDTPACPHCDPVDDDQDTDDTDDQIAASPAIPDAPAPDAVDAPILDPIAGGTWFATLRDIPSIAWYMSPHAPDVVYAAERSNGWRLVPVYVRNGTELLTWYQLRENSLTYFRIPLAPIDDPRPVHLRTYRTIDPVSPSTSASLEVSL